MWGLEERSSRTADVEVQPLCSYGHELAVTLRMVCLGGGKDGHSHAFLTHTPTFSVFTHPAFFPLRHTQTHTHLQVQDSTQYLGGYSGEEGALRDVFGYLQSLYPQGGKHQLLLGRAHGGWGLWGVGWGLMDFRRVREGGCGPRMREQRGKHIET